MWTCVTGGGGGDGSRGYEGSKYERKEVLISMRRVAHACGTRYCTRIHNVICVEDERCGTALRKIEKRHGAEFRETELWGGTPSRGTRERGSASHRATEPSQRLKYHEKHVHMS